tara:strand:- start:3491 stop:4087 length:597 start_codon:yes stop_codon:yes gene_type:complete
MKIHYIFIDIGLEPFEKRKDYQDNIKINSKIYPDYKIWFDKDIEDLINNDYPEYKDKIKQFPYNYMVDIARPFILHKEGGIYCDLDIRIKKELPSREFLHSNWIDRKNKKNKFGSSLMKFPSHLYLPMVDYFLTEWERVNAIKIYNIWKYRKILHTVGPNAVHRFAKLNKLEFWDKFLDYAEEDRTESNLIVSGTKTY